VVTKLILTGQMAFPSCHLSLPDGHAVCPAHLFTQRVGFIYKSKPLDPELDWKSLHQNQHKIINLCCADGT